MRRKSWKSVALRLGVVIGLCLIFSLLVLSQSQAASLVKVKISTTNWVGHGGLYLAKALGYYEEEGIEVEFVKLEDKLSQFSALAADQIQGLCMGATVLLNYYKPEYPVKLVAYLASSFGGDGILVGPEIGSWKDFKGKKIALSYYQSMHMIVYNMIENAGLDPAKDVTWIDMPAGDAATAFAARKVDAAITWEPHLTKVREARADARLFFDTSMPECPDAAGDYLAFNANFVKNHPKEVMGIIRSVFRAREFAKANERKACEIMAKEMGGWLKDPDLFLALYKKSAPRDLNDCYIGMTTGISGAEAKKLGLTTASESIFVKLVYYGKTLLRFGQLQEFPPVEQLIDSSFVRELKKKGLKEN